MALPSISTSDPILRNLRGPQQQVCRHVFAVGSNGMSSGDLQAALNLTPATVTRLTAALVSLGVLKKVPAVRSPRIRNNRQAAVFMDARVEPSAEITGGGRWHHGDGKVDATAVALARRACLTRSTGSPAPPPPLPWSTRASSAGEATQLLAACCRCRWATSRRCCGPWRSAGSSRSAGAPGKKEGSSGGIGAGEVCYRRAGAPPRGGAMEEFPCGVCPVIGQCSPDGGLVSPATCVYFNKWLEMDF